MTVIPVTWIEHRRTDGELVGYLVEPNDDSDLYQPVNIFGVPLGEPAEIVTAMDLLEEVGLGSLAEPWWLRTDDGRRIRVKIYEATPDQVTVVLDDFSAGADLGTRTTLPVPVGDRLTPL